MKPTTINVQITKCPKQYEAVRIGLEASLEAGETVESAIKAATAQLNSIYMEMHQPQQKVAQNAEKAATNGIQEATRAADGREILTFEDRRLQQIVKRMEKDPAKKKDIFESTLKYFAPDEQAMKVLNVAAKMI